MKLYCNLCGCDHEYQVLEGEEFAELRGNSHAELWENSHAELWGNSHAELWENSHAVLRENSHAVLWGNSHAELWENSHAELWENSHAVLRENSHAVLWGNSHAELWGNSHAELWENSHAQCKSPYACGILKSITAECSGRHIGDKPLTPKEYLTACGIEIKNQYVILYKSVRLDFTNGRDGLTKYEIGKETVAPDWDINADCECGNGLHLSPSVGQAKSSHDSGLYLACRVNIKDIASFPAFAQYPDKIRVRACTTLYQVDIEGNKKEA